MNENEKTSEKVILVGTDTYEALDELRGTGRDRRS